jgi:hypothetical protein
MMTALSHCLSSVWPGGRGSRSFATELSTAAVGGELGGVVPVAWDPIGVPALSGPCRALTNRS